MYLNLSSAYFEAITTNKKDIDVELEMLDESKYKVVNNSIVEQLMSSPTQVEIILPRDVNYSKIKVIKTILKEDDSSILEDGLKYQ